MTTKPNREHPAKLQELIDSILEVHNTLEVSIFSDLYDWYGITESAENELLRQLVIFLYNARVPESEIIKLAISVTQIIGTGVIESYLVLPTGDILSFGFKLTFPENEDKVDAHFFANYNSVVIKDAANNDRAEVVKKQIIKISTLLDSAPDDTTSSKSMGTIH